ncbi:MAG: hypothetical protein QNJ22_09030 [Desulfosarcinaceae bacterium]|nr:hypothetical protein [Desulfosarcinaceae bacterium]
MGSMKRCPNCGVKTWDGKFCAGCKTKRDRIFMMTGVSHGHYYIQYGELDRELSVLNFANLLKDAEMQKRRGAHI